MGWLCELISNTYCVVSRVPSLSLDIQGGSNMTGTVYTCLHTNQSRSYLNHLVPEFIKSRVC